MRDRKKQKFAIRTAAAACLLAIGFTCSAAAADTVYVNCDVLRCRKTAEIKDDNIMRNLYCGEKLERTGIKGDFTQIRVGGETCYAATRYLTETAPEQKAPEQKKNPSAELQDGSEVGLDPGWTYADFSKINSGKAVLHRSTAASRKNKTVCVNAGHGTKGGSSQKTYCHPDKTPKVTGGSTGSGAVQATAVSGGMTFADGTPEHEVTLSMALILRDQLLAEGYDVLMIREGADVQLDNIARTVIANNRADCHVALHWDSTSNNKGAFYMSVPNVASYRAMEPVASHFKEHNRLGESLVGGLKNAGVKIFSGGSMAMDLTQTSYSTVPSVDIELGDKVSDHSEQTLRTLAGGLVKGLNAFFGF